MFNTLLGSCTDVCLLVDSRCLWHSTRHKLQDTHIRPDVSLLRQRFWTQANRSNRVDRRLEKSSRRSYKRTISQCGWSLSSCSKMKVYNKCFQKGHAKPQQKPWRNKERERVWTIKLVRLTCLVNRPDSNFGQDSRRNSSGDELVVLTDRFPFSW